MLPYQSKAKGTRSKSLLKLEPNLIASTHSFFPQAVAPVNTSNTYLQLSTLLVMDWLVIFHYCTLVYLNFSHSVNRRHVETLAFLKCSIFAPFGKIWIGNYFGLLSYLYAFSVLIVQIARLETNHSPSINAP